MKKIKLLRALRQTKTKERLVKKEMVDGDPGATCMVVPEKSYGSKIRFLGHPISSSFKKVSELDGNVYGVSRDVPSQYVKSVKKHIKV